MTLLLFLKGWEDLKRTISTHWGMQAAVLWPRPPAQPGVRQSNQAAVSKNAHFPPAPLDILFPGLWLRVTPRALTAVYLEFAEYSLWRKKRMEIFSCDFYLEIFKVLREMKYCQWRVSGQKQERGQAHWHSSFQLVTHLLLEMSDRIAGNL